MLRNEMYSDMLTDSGARYERSADGCHDRHDSCAGLETFYRLEAKFRKYSGQNFPSGSSGTAVRI